jgi:hypothetical protein
MTTVYKPSHRFLGQNALSIEFELRKLAQKLEEMDAAMDATRLGIFGRRS